MSNELHLSKSETPEQKAAAAALVTRIYRDEGYISDEVDAHSAITTYLHKPSTTTFLATVGEVLSGTVSIAEDGADGLPMDIIYEAELAPYRKEGARLGEVCQFIVDKTLIKNLIREGRLAVSETDISLRLLREIIMHGFSAGFDYFAFTINPKHRALYESFGCIQIGAQKTYASVNAAPALAYILDVKKLKQEVAKGNVTNMLLRKIFGR